MRQLQATHLLIHKDVLADDRMRRRAERMSPNITADETRIVDDAALNALVDELHLYGQGSHGVSREVPMVVLFHRYLFGHDEATRTERKERYPNLFSHPMHKLNGYGISDLAGLEWRSSGSPEHRQSTGCVCQPAWQIHTVVGCPFRCAYCSLGWVQKLMMNVEELVEHLDEFIGDPPPHSLYQHDNFTDIAEFEPEYGSSKSLIDYFAARPGIFLELYVGKSDNVDYLLDLDHRGKTTCCWSISMRSQADLIERETASLEARLRSAAKCQEAGYPVRFRYSPIIPVKNWRQELREMVEMSFDLCRPELITFESLRYLRYQQVAATMDVDTLDSEFLASLKGAPETPPQPGSEIPQEFRWKLYQAVIDELERVSPSTPYAFCREARVTWEHFADDFGRHGQHPDHYVCNCGPNSSPDHPLLAAACR